MTTSRQINVGDTITYEPAGCARREGVVLSVGGVGTWPIEATCPEDDDPWCISESEVIYLNGEVYELPVIVG
jgi:hypothetical protein